MATTYCRRVQHHARPAVVAASQNSVRSVKCTQEKPRPPRVKSDGSDGGTALQFSMVYGVTSAGLSIGQVGLQSRGPQP